MKLERTREALSPQEGGTELEQLVVLPPPRPGYDASFYEGFALRGIRVDRVEPGFISCSFTVPPRLTDRDGKFASGAVANLVDEVGGMAMRTDGKPPKVSVDMNISFVSSANVNDELEITSRVLGHQGAYSGTIVLLRNKKTGVVIAEGRHSLFGNLRSKV